MESKVDVNVKWNFNQNKDIFIEQEAFENVICLEGSHLFFINVLTH